MSSFRFLKPDRPNLMMISGDLKRGYLFTFELPSPSLLETLSIFPSRSLRPYLMKEDPMLLRRSFESGSSELLSTSCLFSTYSKSLGPSLKILKLLSAFMGVNMEEETSAQLQMKDSTYNDVNELFWKNIKILWALVAYERSMKWKCANNLLVNSQVHQWKIWICTFKLSPRALLLKKCLVKYRKWYTMLWIHRYL